MNPRYLISFGLIVLTLAFASGCKKEAATTGAQSAATLSADPTMQATLAQMTQLLRKYSAEKNTVPATFEEFVASGYLKPVPTAPAGTKFMIASRQMEVILVDQ